MATDFLAIPDWSPLPNQGSAIAVTDVDGDGRLDVVVLRVEAPDGQNVGSFRVGWKLDATGAVTGGWGPWAPVPDWFSWENDDAGLAVADLDGDGRPELVVFMIDAPEGPNAGFYRVGWKLDATGAVTGGWGPWTPVPDWFSWENQGGDIALADLDGDGRPELVVVMVDAPEGQNAGYYRVGRALDATGAVTGGWGPWTAIPDWFTWENQGAGAAVGDLDGDGRPELAVLAVDNPPAQNAGYVTVGWALDETGRPADGWGPWTAVPAWRFWENAGAGAALAELGAGRPTLIAAVSDDAPGGNAGYLTAVDLALDIDTADMEGVWRLLDFGTEVLAIHAALLHTGDVVFFSGSSNNPANVAPHDFRTRVWHYPKPQLSAPATPIDLFCCGHAALADGRLLAAGGTEQYDPFHGLHDAVIFDPATLTWGPTAHMAGGRWYPSLLALGDGRVLALAGLGADGNLNIVPEVYTDGAGWAALPAPGPWPMYAHLVLLADGRVFYTGGQYGGNNGSRPAMWNLASGATTEVQGLPVPDMRNQSASVLLPPAQAQRVMILGGGGYDMHNQAPAIADVGIVDLTAPTPVYTAGPPLHMARMHLNAVLLPDRTVLASGGAGDGGGSRDGGRRRGNIRPGNGALDDGRQRPGATALPLDRPAHARRQGHHRRLQPAADPGGASDRGLLAAVPVPGPAPRARPGRRGGGARRDHHRDEPSGRRPARRQPHPAGGDHALVRQRTAPRRRPVHGGGRRLAAPAATGQSRSCPAGVVPAFRNRSHGGAFHRGVAAPGVRPLGHLPAPLWRPR